MLGKRLSVEDEVRSACCGFRLMTSGILKDVEGRGRSCTRHSMIWSSGAWLLTPRVQLPNDHKLSQM